MMGYKVRVVGENSQIDWNRFIKETGFYSEGNENLSLDFCLKPYGAKNCWGTGYIEFENTEQAMLFILRWS